MLHEIWATIGIIVGWMILIPLIFICAVIVIGCMKEMINLTIAAINVVAAWLDEKLHKK